MLKLIASVRGGARGSIDEVFTQRAVQQLPSRRSPTPELDDLVAGRAACKRLPGRRGAVQRRRRRRRPVPDPPRLGDDLAHDRRHAKSCCPTWPPATTSARWRCCRRRRARPPCSAAVATETIVLDARRLQAAAGAQPHAARARWRALYSSALRANQAMEAQPERRRPHLLPDAAGRGRGDRRAADRRVAVRALRQLREGLRRHPRRHLAPGSRGRPDVRAGPRADLVPPLRASALHEGLPAGRDPPRAQRRGVHRRHLHRLRQLRAQLPVRRDPDGAAGPEATPARPAVVAAARHRARARLRDARPRARSIGRRRR